MTIRILPTSREMGETMAYKMHDERKRALRYGTAPDHINEHTHTGDLINRLPNKDVIELIEMFSCAFCYVNHPTEQMKRLHEMKWMI